MHTRLPLIHFWQLVLPGSTTQRTFRPRQYSHAIEALEKEALGLTVATLGITSVRSEGKSTSDGVDAEVGG